MSSSPDKKFCTVKGYQMAYVELLDADAASSENGDTLIFLHGNPTSSYLWRNILPPLNKNGRRLIAPDLIGMGDSDKLQNSSDEAYSFVNHAEFLDEFLEDCIGVTTKPVILVVHDWGSGLGFWWTYRNPDLVKGIAYMEAVVKPLTYDHFDSRTADFFRAVRTPGLGEEMILVNNTFIEVMLPNAILRNLTEEEMNAYRAPYLEPGESRLPTLVWPRQVPIDGEPRETFDIVSTYSEWLAETEIPKLMIAADPGVLMVGELLEHAKTFKNQMETSVAGIHFVQEDSPDEIANAIDDWLTSDMFVEKTATGSDFTSSSSVFTHTGSSYFLAMIMMMLLRKLW